MQIINWRNLRTPAIISSLLVLPFMILELTNRKNLFDGFPIPLFGVMWLMALSFILILRPIVRNPRAPEGSTARPLGFLARVAFLMLIAWLWFGLVRDQMPCFLGVPNCD